MKQSAISIKWSAHRPYDTLHYITLHYITSHYITLQHITSHYITLHHITLHHITSHYITLHHITSHYITLHHITSHYITLRHITSHYVTLRHIASHNVTLRHITSHYVTLRYITLHHVTSHYITLHVTATKLWDLTIGRWKCNVVRSSFEQSGTFSIVDIDIRRKLDRLQMFEIHQLAHFISGGGGHIAPPEMSLTASYSNWSNISIKSSNTPGERCRMRGSSSNIRGIIRGSSRGSSISK